MGSCFSSVLSQVIGSSDYCTVPASIYSALTEARFLLFKAWKNGRRDKMTAVLTFFKYPFEGLQLYLSVLSLMIKDLKTF